MALPRNEPGAGQDDGAPPLRLAGSVIIGVRRVRWWTLLRYHVPFRYWGVVRRLVEEQAAGVREKDLLTHGEAAVVTQAIAKTQQLVDAAVSKGKQLLAAAQRLEAAAAELRAQIKVQAQAPVVTLHGQVVTIEEARTYAKTIADRIEQDEHDGVRVHRNLPVVVRASAESLFGLDILAWVKLLFDAFNIDASKPPTMAWLVPLGLALILPVFAFAVTRVYASMIRDRRMSGSGEFASPHRGTLLRVGFVALAVISVVTFIAMLGRMQHELSGFNKAGLAISIALAAAVALAPWGVLLIRVFNGTPELDLLEHLTDEIEEATESMNDVLGDVVKDEAKAEGLREEGLLATTGAEKERGEEIGEAWSVIEVARSIHQQTGTYAATWSPDSPMPDFVCSYAKVDAERLADLVEQLRKRPT